MACASYYKPIEYLTAKYADLSYVRILHALPNILAIDVYANNEPIAKNIKYKTITPYIGLYPGTHTVKIHPAGQTTDSLININIKVAPNSIHTIAIAEREGNIELQTIEDPLTSPLMNKTKVRLVHMSPGTPDIDMSQHDGTALFSGISYREFTDYKAMTPGRYTLHIRHTENNHVILSTPNIVLRPGRNLSFYVVGIMDNNPPLQILMPLDGSSFLPV